MNFHQTAEQASFLKSIGWIVEEKMVSGTLVRAYIRVLPLISISLLKLQRILPDQIDWEWISTLQRKYRVYETNIELNTGSAQPPTAQEDLVSHGFHAAHDYFLTTKTRVIDLTQSEDQLLAAMKPKMRYNIHLTEKHNLTTTVWSAKEVAEQPDLFDAYYALLKQNAWRIKMLLLPQDWIKKQLEAYGKTSFVIGITQKDSHELLAASLFFTSDTTCSYSHNGSTALGRQLMAPSLLVWEGMKTGKRRGLIDFDFDGVYDERYPDQQKRFQGFGRFKAGFGGKELYFPPMYHQLRWPF